jgi:hypothetical protein
MSFWDAMLAAEVTPTVSALEGENNSIAAVLTFRRLFQLPECF